jgi:plastocyanin
MRSVLLMAIGAAALGLAGCGSSSGSGDTAASSGAKEITLSATEYSFDPGTIQIDQPGTYTFTLSNGGSTEHALEVEGQGIEEELDEVSPGNSGQLTVTFSKTGSYEFYCPVDDHRAKGMEGDLTVGAAAGGAGTTEDNGGNTGTETGGGGYGY